MSFIVNRWVRGKDFRGRTALLDQLYRSEKKTLWVLGNRRVGKTSLLRQIVWLCREGVWEGCHALYWDLQGAATVAGLEDAFLESLEDADGIEDLLGLDIDALEGLAFTDVLNKFRRKVKALRGRRFLLLIDECEELVEVAAQEPAVLNAFRRLSQTDSPLQIVLAGSYRFMDLDESDSRTSLFLPDFLPPILLGPFTEAESTALLTEKGIDADVAREIYRTCLGNPHLTQVLGEHYSREKSLEGARSSVARGKILEYYFQSNFQCLPEPHQTWWGRDDLLEALAAIGHDDPVFPYMQQACILGDGDGGVTISPLLRYQLGAAVPDVAPKSTEPDPTPKPVTPAAGAGSPCREVLTWLASHPETLSVLPARVHDLDGATNPAKLTLLAAIEDSSGKLHETLDGASPEYITEAPVTARTAVYLAGSCLYRHYFARAPFSEIEDPWQRAAEMAERDVPVKPAEAELELPNRVAVCLMRCLKADPAARYADIAALRADLES